MMIYQSSNISQCSDFPTVRYTINLFKSTSKQNHHMLDMSLNAPFSLQVLPLTSVLQTNRSFVVRVLCILDLSSCISMHLSCSSLSCISCKRGCRSRGLTRFVFNFGETSALVVLRASYCITSGNRMSGGLSFWDAKIEQYVTVLSV